jgi:hypothetical protein
MENMMKPNDTVEKRNITKNGLDTPMMIKQWI